MDFEMSAIYDVFSTAKFYLILNFTSAINLTNIFKNKVCD